MTYFAASSSHLHVLGGSPAVNRHLRPQRRWTAWEISPHTSQYTLLKLQSRNNNINSNNFKYQDFKSQKHTFFKVLAKFKVSKKTLHKFQIRLCFLRLSTQRAVFELQPRFQIEEQESSSSVLFDPWSGDNQVFFLPPTLYFSDDRKLFSLTAIIFQRKQSQAECFCSVILKILSR